MVKKKTGARRTKARTRQRPTVCPFIPPENRVWDFWRDGVTQSFLSTWSACPEQARLRYVQGWTERRVSEPLEFGNLFHFVLSELYHGKRKLPDAARINTNMDTWYDEWCRDRKVVSSTEEETMSKVFALARPTLAGYVDRWAGDWTGRYKLGCDVVRPVKWIATEQVFRVPFVFPDEKVVHLTGMFDGVFEDAKGGVWLLETKTKSRIDEDGLSASLPFDRQVCLYLWALRQKYGKQVRGVLYNVVRRPGNRLGKTEKLAAFESRIATDIRSKLGTGHHFIRWEVRMSAKELNAWDASYLTPALHDVRAWWEGRRPHYMNPDALFSKYGKASMFNPIVSGDFTGHYRRTRAFNELPGTDTEV